uniref:dihydrolipoyllysine-residue (2-methylpropanoyl)transferase n=1 Tax=Timema genevievae TaxID=629358 RepID=A0A7R9K3R3_TIMGE|nr:unnamed protein product [Timema genevievae]
MDQAHVRFMTQEALYNSNQSSSSDEETPAARTTPLAPPVVGHQNTDTSPRLVDKSLATPAVRRIAVENNVDLSSVQGTGKAGRVLKEDILSYVGKPATLTHNTLNTLEETIVPVKGIMKAMIKSMTLSQSIPHFVYSDEILVGPLNDICKSLKHESQAKGIKLTLLPFFIKAASKALEQYPILNSSLDKNCENIIYKSGHNIGIAMDTPGGLVVPNIKNVQSLSVLELAEKLAKLRSSSLKGSLQLEDVTGGTITLSNIGSIGGTYTKPVILHPEVAIGAFGKIQNSVTLVPECTLYWQDIIEFQGVPRFDLNGKLIRAEVLCVSWAGDHRVIDGATMARFSNAWKHFIENPALLLVTL